MKPSWFLAAGSLVLLGVAICASHLFPSADSAAAAPQEGEPALSPKLKAFLTAEDLDDVDTARGNIKTVSDEDAAAIRSILKRWQNAQAVSNLLFCADLIPEDIRLATLFRGLSEQRDPYYALSALVGLSTIDPARCSARDRQRIVAELLAAVRNTNDIRAQRAALTLQRFAREGEIPHAIALLAHPNETVRHNLRGWLFRTLRERGVKAFATLLRDSGFGAAARRELLADFTDFVADPDGAGDTGPLFSYIPNRTECKPATWKRLDPPLPGPAKAGERKNATEDPVVEPAKDLLEQLQDSAASIRRRAAVALGKEKRPSAVAALARALQDKDARVRWAACDALVRIEPKSVGAIVDVLRSPTEESRLFALSVLNRLARRTQAAITKDQVTTIAAALKDESLNVRFAATGVLGKLGRDATAALPALFEAAGDTSCTAGNTVVAEYAITAALIIDPACGPKLVKAALPRLIEKLKGNEAFAAAYAIARLGPDARAAVPALAEALRDDARYSENIVEALGNIGGDGVKPLAGLVKDPRTELKKREAIFWRLGWTQRADKQLIAFLIDTLKDADPQLRYAAVDAVGRIGIRARASVPALLDLLGDTKVGDADLAKDVAHETDLVAGTLARMRAAAVPGILGAVKDTTRSVLARFRALRALAQMGRKASGAAPVLAAAMKDGNTLLAVTGAGAYVRAGGDVAGALPVLKDGLRSKDPVAMKAAIFEVKRLGPRARVLMPELRVLLKHREREVRRLAARAVGKMGVDAKPAVPALAELFKAGDGRDERGDEIVAALVDLGPHATGALPALIDGLAHEKVRSPHTVLEAIGKIGPQATPALPALRKLLRGELQGDVINVLGEIGPEAVPALLAQLGAESEYTRSSAARALGRIGPGARDAVPALKMRLTNEWKDVRVWSAFALIRITGDAKPYMPVLVELFNGGASLEASEAFVLLAGEARAARDVLLEALFDDDLYPGPHWRVARALGQLADDADVIVPRLLALTEWRPVGRHWGGNSSCLHALEALGMLGPRARAALPRLRALADGENNEIAEAAAQALERVAAR